MTQAEELLDVLTESDLDPTTEEHIIIGTDRIVSVPEPLQRIAVQYDHNIETVTFDCPRYWDEHDLSEMYIYINYNRSDDLKGMYLAKNISVDEENPNMIHFTWTIDQDVTQVEGKIKFLVCAMTTDSEGFQETHWNSEINEQMYVSTGLEVQNEVMERYPAVINDLLTKMDALTGKDVPIDGSLTMSGIAADAAVVGERFTEIDGRLFGCENETINIRSDIGTINEYITNNNTKWSEHEQLHRLMDNAYDRMEGRIDGHDTDIANTNTRIDDLDELYSYCESKTITFNNVTLNKDTGTWDTMLKSEIVSFNLTNKRFFIIIITTNSDSTISSGDIDFVFLLDAKHKKLYILNSNYEYNDNDDIYYLNGNIFSSTNPKVYEISSYGTGSGFGILFTELENGVLKIQACGYNKSSSTWFSNKNCTINIDVTTPLANL